MGLPTQFKSARMTNDTLGVDIDNKVAEVEQALCDIFGFTVDTNVTESPLGCDNSGRITKALIRQMAAGPVGWRFRDSTAGKEFRLALSGTSVLFDENTGSEGTPTWTNRATMALATGLFTFAQAQFTGAVDFDTIPTGPSSDPTTNDQLVRKYYADSLYNSLNTNKVGKSGDETVDGIKTFSSIPVLPASDPTTANQATRKGYVDGKSFAPPVAILQNRQSQNVGGGTATSGSWGIVPLNTEYEDVSGFLDGSALPSFSLPAGTYRIRSIIPMTEIAYGQTRLFNVSDGIIQKNVNAVDMIGTSITAMTAYYGFEASVILGTFTIAGTKQLRIEYRVTTTIADVGFGKPANFGVEVYGQVYIEKIA